MRTIILAIDTSKYDQLIVGLEIEGERKIIKEEFDYRKSQGVLPLIERVLKENNLSLQDLTGIEVNTGPGSFTGLRVGVSIANTLASMLQIPVNNQEIGMLVTPLYE